MPPEPASSTHDPHLVDRLLGTAAEPGDAAARSEAAALALRLRQVALPQARLSGWSSLCAGEYAEAVARLHRVVGLAGGALAVAAGTGR